MEVEAGDTIYSNTQPNEVHLITLAPS